MDRRTKIISGLFGASLVYALFSSLVYPAYVEPLLKIDDRIAKREKDLAKLEEQEARVHEAKLEYRDYLDRVGSFDELKVQNALRERLNLLIERHKLEDANTSPSRPQEDRKTKIKKMHITVTAVGALESATGFLEEISELPGLVSIGNAAIYPAGGSRRGKRLDRVNIRVPIEVWVLPQQRMLGRRLEDEDLRKPDVFVRHEDRDYSPIWLGKHFTEFIPLKPLIADAGPNVKTKQNDRRISLKGKAKGGDGKYTYVWSPTERLSDPTSPKPRVDTSEAGTVTYTLTVKDGAGNTARDDVTVTIRESKPKVAAAKPKSEPPPPPPPPPPPDNRWKDRKFLQLRMTLMRNEGGSRLEEVMVYNTKSMETVYYPAGSEFDGGTLVCVHPRGGIVRRDDEYYLYPIGERLNNEFKADEAADYPVLQRIARRIREAEPAVRPPEDNGDGENAEPEPKAAAGETPAGGDVKPDPDEPAASRKAVGVKAGVVQPEAAPPVAKPAAKKKNRKPGARTGKPGNRGVNTKRRINRAKVKRKP